MRKRVTSSQVYHMPHKDYNEWVYKERCDDVVLIEGWKIADNLMTRMSYRWVFAWVFPIIYIYPSHNPRQWLAVVILSFFTVWPLVEMVLHKYVFHMNVNSTWKKLLHFALHGVHHVNPHDLTRLVMPFTASVPIATIIWYILMLVTWDNKPLMQAIMCGILLGYVKYDLTHYMLHAVKPEDLPKWIPEMSAKWYKKLYAQHRSHHFTDHTKDFAVSYLQERAI